MITIYEYNPCHALKLYKYNLLSRAVETEMFWRFHIACAAFVRQGVSLFVAALGKKLFVINEQIAHNGDYVLPGLVGRTGRRSFPGKNA